MPMLKRTILVIHKRNFKHKRDLLVYLLWNKGLMSNEHLEGHFNISYSTVSHSVKIFKERVINETRRNINFNRINSQFKP